MTGTLVGDGELIMLEALKAVGVTCRLNSNNVTPGKATVTADLTEVSGGGYAPIALAANSGTVTPRSGGTPAFLAWAEQTFGFTGVVGNVYTVSIHRTSDNKLLSIEPLPGAPVNFQTNGSSYKFTPKVSQA